MNANTKSGLIPRYVPELPSDKINRNGYNLNKEEIKYSRISVVLNSIISLSDLRPDIWTTGAATAKNQEWKYVNKTLE